MDQFCKALRGLFVSLINGAASGAATYFALPGGVLPQIVEWRIVGSAALTGAIVGGISYILRSPYFRDGG